MSTIIKLSNVTKTFDAKLLYKNVSFRIYSGEKVLICGENGCGKTTLIRLILKEIKPDEGVVFVNPNISISHLGQYEYLKNDITVIEYIDNIFKDVIDLEKNLRKYEQSFSDSYNNYVEEEYIKLLDNFEQVGGYEKLKQKDEFINLFGFTKILRKKISELSGGEQQYLRLASVIFNVSSVIIVDEPFSYLDKEKSKWLMSYLKNIKQTVIMVTHDFYLARIFCTTIINIHDWTVKRYDNGYEKYLKERESEQNKSIQTNTTIEKYIHEKEYAISQRKNWMKKAENKHKHAVIIRRLERDIERANKNKIVGKPTNNYNLRSLQKKYINNIDNTDTLIILKNVNMLFEQEYILRNVSISFECGKHYIITGKNGSGKTTLLKLITRQLIPSQGKVVYTRNIRFSIISQMDISLKKDITCFDYIKHSIPLSKEELNVQYANFFDDDFWDKRVSTLSGGERKRLEIFTHLLNDFDVLILDEPTIFIDNNAKIEIIDMINACSKCVIVATHDLDILNNIKGREIKIVDNMVYF